MIKQINVEIKSVKDFGRAVLCAQDELDTGESLSVKFTDRWNGFKGMGTKEAIVANCADLPHDPDEIMRKDPFTKDIP